MAVVTSILSATLFPGTLLGGALTIGGLTVGQLLTGVAVIGGSIAQYQQAKAQEAALARAMDQRKFKTTRRGTVLPQTSVYGRVLCGGTEFFADTVGKKYVWGGTFAAHRIAGVDRFLINGVEVEVDADGWVLTKPFYRDTKSLARLSLRLGDPDQAADPILMQRFPELGAGFRQRGHATIVGEFDWGDDREEFDKVWGGQLPEVTAVIRGKPVYDPSDPTQQRDVEPTWRWSDSPTLIAADLATSDLHGRLPRDLIDWPALVPSILIDREEVPTRAGTFERRYTCDGIVDTAEATVNALRAVLACNRGALVWSPSGYRIVAGWRREPVATLASADLRGPLSYRADMPRSDLVNIVRVRQQDPDAGDQTTEGAVIRDEAAIAADGRELEVPLDLQMVRGVARAKRLGRAFLTGSRLGRQISTEADLRHILIEPEDLVHVSVPELAGLDLDGLWSAATTGLSPDLQRVVLTLAQHSPDIYPDTLEAMEPA